jgi:hypothetical protein
MPRHRLLGLVAGAFAAAMVLSAAAPRIGRACGGLFCNQPPPNPFDPLPIAQTGENVVFAVNKNESGVVASVEAHIQIFYAGPADKFSWIVPVDAKPELSVGSDQLFTSVNAVTRPSFETRWRTEGTCLPEPAAGPSFDASAPRDSAVDLGAGGSPGGVSVEFRGDVGPYDAAVIHSTSSAELIKWLTDNMYFVPDSSIAIIDEYVDENKYFVALRLQNGRDVLSIQPVVLKFPGTEPCVPLRLTAIASVADLPVNLWVLGDARVVPKNYFEIILNEARIDWLSGGRNYADLVKQAANEAGGNAFIAEYAGTARVMDKRLWPDPGINLAALRTIPDPPSYLTALVAQRLTRFAPTLSLLRNHIPLPQKLRDMGVSEAEFYANNLSYWSRFQADFAPFDPNKLTDAIDAMVVTPLRDSQALFDRFPYLTRLATYISPAEMDKDPLFIFNEELPTVSNVRAATATILCGESRFRSCAAPVRVDLADGRSVYFHRNGTCSGAYERTAIDRMPALGIAYQREEVGDGAKVVDNTAAITSALTLHNAAVSVSSGIPVDPKSSTPTPTGGSNGSGGSSGGNLARGSRSDCGCTVAAQPATASLLLGASILAMWTRRRRR